MPYFLSYQYAQWLAAASTRDQITGRGDISKLEELLEKHYGKGYALGVSNAACAMLATALAADLRGAEIIISPYTVAGAVGALGLLGNTFAIGAVVPNTLSLDPDRLKESLSSRTRAVLSTDQGGTAADHKRIGAFCTAHGLLYISDSSCSLGARDALGRAAGARADITIVSFTQGKAVQAGEGAAIITGYRHLYDRLLQSCQHPERQRKELGSFAATEFAPLNGRIHPLAANLLVGSWTWQLDRLRDRQERIARLMSEMSGQGIDVSPYASHPVISTYFNPLLSVDPALLPEHLQGAVIYPRTLSIGTAGPHSIQVRVPSIVATQLEEFETKPYLPLNTLLRTYPRWLYC